MAWRDSERHSGRKKSRDNFTVITLRKDCITVITLRSPSMEPNNATSASSSSPNSSIQRCSYHVFLSFKGDDTRTNFTDHLYTALKRSGIEAFRDDNEHDRGESISEKLVKAIQESMFAVIVISENFAFSPWCLDEVEKIVESKDLKQNVFPIFYKVDPSDVRKQRNSFAAAFEKHKRRFTDEKMDKWKDALTKVADISGWDARDKHEAGIIDGVLARVWTKLRSKLPSNFEHLVGIKSKADEMISILKIGLDDKYFIVIWGMGGIGKTTLARVVFDAIQRNFEASCFLANVREDLESNSLVQLQKKLLSSLLGRNIEINDSYEGVGKIREFLRNKKVLIVLDEINHIDQLENLVGDKKWFGNGSRIIVTTRDIHLLRANGQFTEYKIGTLDKNDSLKLLCQKAFKKDEAEEGYLEFSEQVVRHVGGLPLALQVLGSFLCKRSQIEWRDTVDTLKHNFHHEDILKTLRISYDGLKNEEYKTMFLDIACFFNGMSISEATRIWENCGLRSITIGINVLVEKSLLRILHLKNVDILHMHDLLQDMGKKIVLEESRNDVRRCSRLWSQPQIDPVLTRIMGTKKIQSIFLKLEQQCNANWHPDCFSKMCNLRLLYLRNVHLSCSLNSLPSALKVLIWEKCPLKALPQNIDQLYELVELQLCQSNIRRLWNKKLFLGNLKLINLSHSEVLIETPDFSGVLNLENLFLDGCISLVKVHESLGQLKKLIKLSLSGCKSLVTFPRKLETDSLEELILSGCNKLEELPEFGENMNRLSIFDTLGCCNIRQVPSSIVHLTNLKELSFPKCKGQSGNLGRSFSMFRRISNPMGLKLPNSFTGLSLLTKLDFSCCNLCDGSIPNDLNGLSSLMILDLSENNFTSLPIGCISNLVNLERFDLNGCSRLQSMPHLSPNLLRVDASGCPSMQPLLDVQHLYASLFSRRRDVASHEVILMLISGDTIPITWFDEQERHVDPLGESASIVVDIPSAYNDMEWSGIAICLKVKPRNLKHFHIGHTFSWSFKGAGDYSNNSLPNIQKREIFIKNAHSEPQLFIAFFPFNTQNCGQHLSNSEARQLEFQIEVGKWCDVKDCGWRLICEQDFDI